MSGLRIAVIGLVLSAAVVLQVSVFSFFSVHGVVPDLVLLVVVAAGVARGAQTGMLVGFAGGLLLDLTPPADHLAGRWALALLVVGYVAGRVTQEARPTALSVMATVASCSFLGTSLYALGGLILRDPPVGVPDLLPVIALSVGWDLLLAPLLLPALLGLFSRLDPEQALA